ncbi:MAG: oligosaccharide flippase family protein [Bacteroidetes bacterium]|nr:oligosaccharide flippase family protein [Bacteroidota bacterium]
MTKNSLIKNWSYLLLSDVSQAVIGFFVFMFLARKLNPEGYGTLNALLALASLFSIFAMNVSANLVISREITLRPKTTAGIFMITFPIRMVSLVISILALVFYETCQGERNIGLISNLILFIDGIWIIENKITQ